MAVFVVVHRAGGVGCDRQGSCGVVKEIRKVIALLEDDREEVTRERVVDGSGGVGAEFDDRDVAAMERCCADEDKKCEEKHCGEEFGARRDLVGVC